MEYYDQHREHIRNVRKSGRAEGFIMGVVFAALLWCLMDFLRG